MTVYIAGLGEHHPEQRITNADLAALVDTSDAWIDSHIGIVERRRAPEGQGASDLGAAAVRDCLADAELAPSDLDLIVCATSTPDVVAPPTACYIAGKLGIRPTAFDVDAACSGFLVGLAVAGPLVETGQHRRAALVATECYTRFTDYGDRTTCIYFGDGAACALLQTERPRTGYEVIDVITDAEPDGTEHAYLPHGGHVVLDGPELKQRAVPAFIASATRMLDRHGLAASDLAAFAGHQMNYRLLEHIAATLGVDPSRHWHTVRELGNRGAAGCPATLVLKSREVALRDGELVLLTVFGAGFLTASALLRRVAP